MILKIKILLNSILIFFLIYDFSLLSIPVITSGRLVTLFLIIKKIFSKKSITFDKKFIFFVTVLFCFILISIFQYTISLDFIQSSRLLWFTIYSVIAPYLVREFFFDQNDFLRTFFIATIIQSIITISSFLNFDVKQLLLSNIVVGGNDIVDSFRAIGFTSASGASFSLIQFCGVYSGLILLKKSKFKLIEYTFILFGIISCFLSTLIIGRTGLIFSLLALLYFLFSAIKFKKIFVYMFIIILLAQIRIVSFINIDSEQINGINTELFMSWIEDGFQLKNNSTTTAIKQMPIPPLTVRTILGTGEVFDEIKSENSSGNDSGYIQTYYSMGIILAFLFYSSYLCFLLTFKQLKNGFYIYFLIILLFIAEIKEPFIFKYIFPFYILTLILCTNRKKLF